MSGSRTPSPPLNPAKTLVFLTDVRKGGIKRRSFNGAVGTEVETPLPSDAMFDLVERLIRLSADDFLTVVASAKLYRRFEEGNRSRRGQ